MPNSGHHIKFYKKRRRAPLFLRRSPWVILGVIIGLALFHFVPAISNSIDSIATKEIEINNDLVMPPERPEVFEVPNIEPPVEIDYTELEYEPLTTRDIEKAERETFELINQQRIAMGLEPTTWDKHLYILSKDHTEEMAEKGELFHSPENASHGENCWGGVGYSRYSVDELASAIVDSWMSSPLHKAWLLHKPIRHSAVSIVISDDGQFASWTFWIDEVGLGPELVQKISMEWESTGGDMPWIDWLIINGYLEH